MIQRSPLLPTQVLPEDCKKNLQCIKQSKRERFIWCNWSVFYQISVFKWCPDKITDHWGDYVSQRVPNFEPIHSLVKTFFPFGFRWAGQTFWLFETLEITFWEDVWRCEFEILTKNVILLQLFYGGSRKSKVFLTPVYQQMKTSTVISRKSKIPNSLTFAPLRHSYFW